MEKLSRPARFLLLAFITACILALAIGYLDAQEPLWVWVPGKGRVLVDRKPTPPAPIFQVDLDTPTALDVYIDCPKDWYVTGYTGKGLAMFRAGKHTMSYLRQVLRCEPMPGFDSRTASTPNSHQMFFRLR